MITPLHRRLHRLSSGLIGCALLACAAAEAATPLGNPWLASQTLAGDQQTPDVAMAADGRFVVVWNSLGQDGSLDGIFARQYAADGTPLGDEFGVTQTTRNRQLRPTVAMAADGRFVVGWVAASHDRSPGISLWARRYAADGTPQGDEFQLNDGERDAQPQLDLAMDARGDFVAVWPETVSAFLGGIKASHIVARRFAANGSAPAAFEVDSSLLTGLRIPRVAVNAGGHAVFTWSSDAVLGWLAGILNPGMGIYVRAYDTAGRPTGLPRRIAAVEGEDVLDQPEVSVDAAGNAVIAWQHQHPDLSPAGIVLRRVDTDGKPLGDALAADLPALMSYDPALATLDSGAFAVASYGPSIQLREFAADGTALAVGQRADAALLPASALLPALASNGQGRYVACWQQRDDGQRDIACRVFVE